MLNFSQLWLVAEQISLKFVKIPLVPASRDVPRPRIQPTARPRIAPKVPLRGPAWLKSPCSKSHFPPVQGTPDLGLSRCAMDTLSLVFANRSGRSIKYSSTAKTRYCAGHVPYASPRASL
eukprot:scaffold44176_cov61-Phaeocystis_antarctica.AAC.5